MMLINNVAKKHCLVLLELQNAWNIMCAHLPFNPACIACIPGMKTFIYS